MMGKVTGAVLLVVCSAMGALGDPGLVKVVSTKKDIVYFKVDKYFLNAEGPTGILLEVFDRYGNKIIEQRLEKRKVVVDFYYDQPGTYQIRISKGPAEQIFYYDKAGPSHAE